MDHKIVALFLLFKELWEPPTGGSSLFALWEVPTESSTEQWDKVVWLNAAKRTVRMKKVLEPFS
jgi:hypothetical protein